MKEEKLPRAFKTKWIEALRSGKYKQGHCRLRKKDRTTGVVRYCCLGVAAELCGLKFNEKASFIANHSDYKVRGIRKVPAILRGYTSIGNPIPNTFSKMNDMDGYSFRKIATWIEKNL